MKTITETKIAATHPLGELMQTNRRPSVLGSAELAVVARAESAALAAARHYFEKEGFTEVTVPHITQVTGACENIDTLFELDYFGESGYLVQTGQLYLEALISRLGKVYCIGPSFRAEPDIDERHLTEFTLVEIEFPGDFEQLLAHMENITYAMIHAAASCEALAELGINTGRLKAVKKPFARMTYDEAIKKLQQHGIDISWGDDLKSKHEKLLAGDSPLFITHYPEKIKFFNMRRNGLHVNSCDLILPRSGEAAGAAEREHDHKLLCEKLVNSEMYEKLRKRGKDVKDFKWYLDIVEKYPIQHAGCGIGLNRVMQFILDTDDIRACTPFPMNRESLM
ncbi:MAG: asparaginyl-tRNA synthetase [archaeon GW2011_AR5]|nr:MAG: asparaginyl-tRNA synthetase [archaeon GW2011_AR5]